QGRPVAVVEGEDDASGRKPSARPQPLRLGHRQALVSAPPHVGGLTAERLLGHGERRVPCGADRVIGEDQRSGCGGHAPILPPGREARKPVLTEHMFGMMVGCGHPRPAPSAAPGRRRSAATRAGRPSPSPAARSSASATSGGSTRAGGAAAPCTAATSRSAARAAALGYETLALTDHDGLCGSLAFAHAAREAGIRAVTGAEITLVGGAHLTLLAETAAGYRNLCRLITAAHAGDRRAPAATLDEVARHADGLHCLSGCARHGLLARPVAEGRLREAEELGLWLRGVFGRDRFTVELQRPYARGDARRNRLLTELAERLRVRTAATGDPHAHSRRRALLQDALVAIQKNTTLEACEADRRGNHEAVLRAPAETAARFPDEAVRGAFAVADRCRFDLTEDLGYSYPDFGDNGEPAGAALARICRDELERRYTGSAHMAAARARLDEELRLIERHGLAGFFLLHRDILEMARDVAARVRGRSAGRHLLPPGRGRGSSVGSIVCYLIGLSHVDPIAARLFLGRFLSEELASVPDIDLDFPRDVREGLMLDVVERYGPEHAALVAAFPTYRVRGAVRDLGKALALPPGEVERMARLADEWGAIGPDQVEQMRERADSPRWRAFAFLMEEIMGLPRHISQHSGGMVISTRPLVELVPVIPAAMEGRQICQWDKDSCADAGFLKIDLLGLGMLSAVEECVDLIAETRGAPIDLSRVGFDDPA